MLVRHLSTQIPRETRTSFFLQTLVPFLFAGVGLVLAGQLLERAEGNRFFVQLPDVVMIVPTLVGLKGNLEMTLSSRLSTLSNLGLMETKKELLNVALTNVALVQTQAIVVSSLAVVPVLVLGEQAITATDTICILLCTVLTASLASFLLSVLMVVVIVGAKKFKLNPDNISTPVAASLGDVSTLLILLAVGTVSVNIRHNNLFSFFVTLLLFYGIAVYGAIVAVKDRFTREVLKNGWWPVLASAVISTASGLVLKKSMEHFAPIAAFQPLINGLGGNLVAVQASRISTQLHRARKNKDKEVGSLKMYLNPLRAFIHKSAFTWLSVFDEDSAAAKILLMVLLPSVLVFTELIFFFGCGFSNTLSFTCSFLFVCTLQVIILLYVCQILVPAMWVMRIDPDNSAIPFLTALGDLIGSLLLIGCFVVQADIFDLPIRVEHFPKYSKIN